MPKREDERWHNLGHPPYCTCVDCAKRRLGNEYHDETQGQQVEQGYEKSSRKADIAWLVTIVIILLGAVVYFAKFYGNISVEENLGPSTKVAPTSLPNPTPAPPLASPSATPTQRPTPTPDVTPTPMPTPISTRTPTPLPTPTPQTPTPIPPVRDETVTIDGQQYRVQFWQLNLNGKVEATITLPTGEKSNYGSNWSGFTLEQILANEKKSGNKVAWAVALAAEVKETPITPTPYPAPTSTLRPLPTASPTSPLSGGAQTLPAVARLAELDAHSLNAPVSVQSSIKALATYLASPARNDFEKGRTIFRWITQNVAYDAKGFFAKRYGDQSPEGVLRTRLAVCQGYSELYEALGRAAGLEVLVIDGWAKGYGYDVKELNGDTNHAWNAIKVDGGWYLLDSTWGAGYLDETGSFVREFQPYYWLTPPSQFIYNHLPSDARWQLLPTQVTKTGYAGLPMLKSGFFDYGLQLPPGTQATTSVVNQTTLLVSAPQDILLTTSIEQNGRKLDNMWTSVQRKGTQYEIKAVFPGTGKYDLVIFARRTSETGNMYKGVASLGYEVSQGQPEFAGFPLTFDEFYSYGLQLPPNIGAKNRVASQTALLISTPLDVLLTATIEQNGRKLDDTLTFKQRKGSQYELEAVFPSPGKYDLTIFAKRKGDIGDYKSVVRLGYEVSQGLANFAGFPITFTRFAESGSYLYTPKQSGLALGSSQVFKINVPGAREVAVIAGDVWTKLGKQGESYEGTVTILKKPVQVCAAFDTSNSYNCLLEYR